MTDERPFYAVRFNTGMSLTPGDLNEEYIVEIEADVIASYVAQDCGGEVDRNVGRVLAFRIHGERAIADGVPMFEMYDAHSQGLHDYFCNLFDHDTGEFTEEIQRQFELISGSDLLIIDLVEILPEYRGNGVGLAAVLRTMDMFGPGCDLFVMKPFPLQFDAIHRRVEGEVHPDRAALGLEEYTLTREEVFAKMQQHWEQLGFKRIHGTDCWGLCPALEHPNLHDLGLGL